STLVSQFLMESIMTSFLAMGLAVLIAVLLLPYFNRLSGKSLTIGIFSNYWLVPGLLFTAVIVGLLAGSYPAFFLSAFRPTDVLKGKLSTGFKNGWLRNGLVIFQFATAIILIVGTMMIYSQLNFIRHKDLGYNRQQVLVLRNIYSLGTHWSTFKDEVLRIQGVTAGTIAGTLPISERYNSNAFSKDAALSAGQTIVMGQWEVGADYIPTLGMRMVKGRNFSLDMPTDSSAIIINQTAARMLGLKDPINKRLYQWDQGSHPVSYHIIGVVHDFNTGSLRNKIAPIVFNLAVNRSLMAFRINTKNTAAVVAKIKDKYQAITGMAGQPFVYSFMDADYNRLYWSEERTGELFIYFALFAILLACLGLFGLVTYAAKRRTKEVGIRKVLGASVGVIVKHLSLDFLKLVMVATVIAIPVAWWAMNRWLQDFAYRTTIHWWVFLLAGALVLLIALITVSFQAIKAAVANPVKSLRTE
ncbi:MAG TPA: FtsX-like permease family protein, partial [Chitinophagaceae bacterium]|nr:FtsX-like permease family protein [Chitinophagaceae bacterium]